jgi:hypothetical protein
MPRASVGRIFTLTILPPDQMGYLESRQEYVIRRIAAGQRITRYGREWIVGKTAITDGVLSGRIGYQGPGSVVEIWDEERQDFEDIAVPAGLTAPFAIHLSGLLVALQPRGSEVSLNALAGAFSALLSEGDYRWTLVGSRKRTTFDHWLGSVSKVISMRATVRRPNPTYGATPDIQALLEQEEAEVVSVEIRNETEGITRDSAFVQQTEIHIERGYGEATYTGVRERDGQRHETVYSTSGGAEDDSVSALVDPVTGEVDAATLREVLARNEQEDDT